MSRKPGGKGSDSTSGAGSKGTSKSSAGRETRQNRWRRIEALRERRALRDALEDVLGDDFDIDDAIFGISPEDERYFIQPKPAPEDTSFDEDADDDDFDDDDEDLDDDLEEDFDEESDDSDGDEPAEDEER